MNIPASYEQSFGDSVEVIWERIVGSAWKDIDTVECSDTCRQMTFAAQRGRSVLTVSRSDSRTLVTIRGPYVSCIVVPGEERTKDFDPFDLAHEVFDMLHRFEVSP